MLIYHPNLNLNCGRLCSIMFPSPAFKDCQLFFVEKEKGLHYYYYYLLFFFQGDGMRPGVGAERLSGKAESRGR